MSTSKRTLKVTLHSATISTFLWWGNSDPIDAEDTFEDSMDSLYQGTLCLMPHKPLDTGFTYPIDSSWTLIHDYSELNEQDKKEMIEGLKPINRVIAIECGEIEFELEDSDYDGYEGDFYYHLKAEIFIESSAIDENLLESTVRESFYRNLCFIEEIASSSKFETKSEDGRVIEIEDKKYLLVPLSTIEIDGIANVSFKVRCNILGAFWYEYREDEDLKPFMKYNDVGLPLAWFISTGVVAPLPMAEDYINETFAMFLNAMEVTEEDVRDVDNLNDLLAIVEQKKIERDSK